MYLPFVTTNDEYIGIMLFGVQPSKIVNCPSELHLWRILHLLILDGTGRLDLGHCLRIKNSMKLKSKKSKNPKTRNDQ